MNVKNYSKLAMMMTPTTSDLFEDAMRRLNSNTSHPWDKVSLSKFERRGKTYEELQAMRKQKYEEAQQAIQPDNASKSL